MLTSIGTPSIGESTVLRGVSLQKRTPPDCTVQGIPSAELIVAWAAWGSNQRSGHHDQPISLLPPNNPARVLLFGSPAPEAGGLSPRPSLADHDERSAATPEAPTGIEPV